MGVQIKLHRKGQSGLDLQETLCVSLSACVCVCVCVFVYWLVFVNIHVLMNILSSQVSPEN